MLAAILYVLQTGCSWSALPAGAIDWSRASVDSMHVRAVKGGT